MDADVEAARRALHEASESRESQQRPGVDLQSDREP